jgi:hypothetical protein
VSSRGYQIWLGKSYMHSFECKLYCERYTVFAEWPKYRRVHQLNVLRVHATHMTNVTCLVQQMGSVDVPQEAFMAVLSIDRSEE